MIFIELYSDISSISDLALHFYLENLETSEFALVKHFMIDIEQLAWI